MGNEIVIPSAGEWYLDPLRRCGITNMINIDSGTFLVTLKGTDQSGNPVIIKAYQFPGYIQEVNEFQTALLYFKELQSTTKWLHGVLKYDRVILDGNTAYLIRNMIRYTLQQRVEEYPPLNDGEKVWIVFQLLNSVLNLHGIGLTHGSLNPDNVFISNGLYVSIGDMAPFKPSHIRADRANAFYHYYTTASRGSCYLAPEQIISVEQKTNIVQFNHFTYAHDLFAVGCIIYFLYTGKHMLTFSQLSMLKNGELSIDLSEIPGSMRDLTECLISVDVEKRSTVSEDFHMYFQSCFQQLYIQSSTFYETEITISTLIDLMPVFEDIGNSSEDARVALSSILIRYLVKSDDPQSLPSLMYFLASFTSLTPTEFMLTRILPFYIDLIEGKRFEMIVATSMRCIEILLSKVEDLPPGTEDIYEAYIEPKLFPLGSSQSINIRSSLASVLPSIIPKLKYAKNSVGTQTTRALNFILMETNECVLKSFSKAINKLAGASVQTLLLLFALILSCLNNDDVEFKEEMIDGLISFYDKSKQSERLQYQKIYKTLAPAVLGFMENESSTKAVEKYIFFLGWLYQNNFVEKHVIPAIYKTIMFVKSDDPYVLYALKKLHEILPKDNAAINIPDFVWYVMKSANSATQTPIRSIKRNKSLREPLVPHVGFQMTPSFHHSIRVSRSPICSAAATYVENSKALLADSKGALYSINNSLSSQCIIQHVLPITAITSIRGTTNSLVCDSSGDIMMIDLEKPFLCSPRISMGSSIVSCLNLGNGGQNVAALAADGSISIADLRLKSPANVMQFDNLHLTCGCRWQSGYLIAAGSEEGIVNLIDTRVCLPVYSIVTGSASSIIPISCGECAIGVQTPDGFECYDNNGMMIATVPIAPASIAEYDGNAILADERDVFCINLSELGQSITLHERGVTSPMIVSGFHPATIQRPLILSGMSLHRHTTTPSLITRLTDMFVSCDSTGFAHFWSL